MQQATRPDARTRLWVRRLRKLLPALGVAAMLGTTSAAAQTEAWPSKPVRIVVPYAPGGIADISARSVGQKMAELTGQSFIIENRPGADTRIGTEAVSREQGNDHILLLAGGGFAVNNSLFDDLRYDTAKDFIPLGLVVSNPLLLVMGKEQPYGSVMELVEAAKAGENITLASGGKGTLSHMSMELLASRMSAPITHVPYKGGSAHTADVVSGLVTGIFENPSSALPLVRGGKYKVIATTGASRNPVLPDVPTVAESGVEGFEVINWFGLFSPAGVPESTVQRMAAVLSEALQDEALRKRFASEGVSVGGMMTQEFATFVQNETVKWGDIIRAQNIRAND